jgi:hypothetical protein
LQKDISLVRAFPVLNDENQPNKAKNASDTPNSKDSDDLELSYQANLKFLSEWTRQKKNNNVAEKTDDVINENENALVEALSICGSAPEHRYRTADEHLEKQHHDVVNGHDEEEAVDPFDVGLVRSEDAGEEEKNSCLDGEDCWAVVDHGCIDGLASVNMVVGSMVVLRGLPGCTEG